MSVIQLLIFLVLLDSLPLVCFPRRECSRLGLWPRLCEGRHGVTPQTTRAVKICDYLHDNMHMEAAYRAVQFKGCSIYFHLSVHSSVTDYASLIVKSCDRNWVSLTLLLQPGTRWTQTLAINSPTSTVKLLDVKRQVAWRWDGRNAHWSSVLLSCVGNYCVEET